MSRQMKLGKNNMNTNKCGTWNEAVGLVFEVFSLIRGDMEGESGVMRQETRQQIKVYKRMRTAKQKEAMPAVNPQAILWTSVSYRPVMFLSCPFIMFPLFLTYEVGQTNIKIALILQTLHVIQMSLNQNGLQIQFNSLLLRQTDHRGRIRSHLQEDHRKYSKLFIHLTVTAMQIMCK